MTEIVIHPAALVVIIVVAYMLGLFFGRFGEGDK